MGNQYGNDFFSEFLPEISVGHVSRGSGWFEVREGKLPGQELPEAEGEGEDVRLDGVLCTLCEDLRGHPSQVARLFGHVLLPQVGQEPRLPEVSHDGSSLLVKEDVVGVEVPVYDGLGEGVKVVHASGYVQGNIELLSDVHDVSVLVEDTKQRASSNELRHNGKLTGVLETRPQHFDYIRTVETPWIRECL